MCLKESKKCRLSDMAPSQHLRLYQAKLLSLPVKELNLKSSRKGKVDALYKGSPKARGARLLVHCKDPGRKSSHLSSANDAWWIRWGFLCNLFRMHSSGGNEAGQLTSGSACYDFFLLSKKRKAFLGFFNTDEQNARICGCSTPRRFPYGSPV